MASEWFTLTDQERLRLLPLVAGHITGRVPFVAGVSGVSVSAAKYFAAAARDAGADAVIAMPPVLAKLPPAELLRYYEAVSEAAQLPVCIQNAPAAPINPDLVSRLVREVAHVHYVKEEVEPAHHNIRRRLEVGDSKVWGVFGGAGGQNFIDELERGASGTMPAPHFTDVLRQIYDLYAAGEHAAARELHIRLMPGLQRERLSGVPFDKEVLVRRGVIRSARTPRRRHTARRLRLQGAGCVVATPGNAIHLAVKLAVPRAALFRSHSVLTYRLHVNLRLAPADGS